MTKKLLLVLLTALTMTAPVLVVAGPAEAARNRTPGCITKAEFRAVKKGNTIARARTVIGAPGRTTYSTEFSDGDVWRTVEFRQCKRKWNRSYVSMSFESTEREVWVSNVECYDFDGDGYDETCEDYGYYETQYAYPLRLESKSAYWS